MDAVSFTVLGVPAPQGSKVKTRWGGIREDNPNTQPWRDSIAHVALTAMDGEPPLLGPLNLRVTFYMPRPRAHFGTGRNANHLKENAPVYCDKKPDVDKLLRALCDAMTTGGVWRDDNQVAAVTAFKVYAFPDQQPGCDVAVEPLALATRRAIQQLPKGRAAA